MLNNFNCESTVQGFIYLKKITTKNNNVSVKCRLLEPVTIPMASIWLLLVKRQWQFKYQALHSRHLEAWFTGLQFFKLTLRNFK